MTFPPPPLPLSPSINTPPLPEDPFATTEGSGAIAQELDLFAMMPADTGPPVVSPPTFSEAPTIIAPIAAPTPSSTTTTITIDTTTTESAAAPTLDIFGGKVLSLSLCLCTMMMMTALLLMMMMTVVTMSLFRPYISDLFFSLFSIMSFLEIYLIKLIKQLDVLCKKKKILEKIHKNQLCGPCNVQ